MLLSFSVSNYLSFREKSSISLVLPQEADTEAGTLALPFGSERALKVALIAGPTGSGKSSLVEAIAAMKRVILSSGLSDSALKRISAQRFMFDEQCADRPSLFEMTLALGDSLYRYGFGILNAKIHSEWLYRIAPSAAGEAAWFIRTGNALRTDARFHPTTSDLVPHMHSSLTALAVFARAGNNEAGEILRWFRDGLTVLTDVKGCGLPLTYERFTPAGLAPEDVQGFMKQIDPTIVRIKANSSGFRFVRRIAGSPDNAETAEVPFECEASGLQDALALSGPWLNAVRNGGTLIVDDFGMNFHPKLSQELARILQTSEKVSSQLIAVTHDESLIRRGVLREESVWTAVKSRCGATALYGAGALRGTDPQCGVR